MAEVDVRYSRGRVPACAGMQGKENNYCSRVLCDDHQHTGAPDQMHSRMALFTGLHCLGYCSADGGLLAEIRPF